MINIIKKSKKNIYNSIAIKWYSYYICTAMNTIVHKYYFLNRFSILSRIVIAFLFIASIIGTELIKMSHFTNHFSIEKMDYKEKGESEKEGKKESKTENIEMDDYNHYVSLKNHFNNSNISHNHHYQTICSDSYLNIPLQPPEV